MANSAALCSRAVRYSYPARAIQAAVTELYTVVGLLVIFMPCSCIDGFTYVLACDSDTRCILYIM